MANPDDLAGYVIQIDPESENKTFRDCLAIVKEQKTWGVLAYVSVPGKGDAYVRVPNEDFIVIGKAKWTRPETTP